MMPAPTQILAAEASLRPTVFYRRKGTAMRDQTSLIEAHIPGLRRFACALLRGDRQSADDLVQDCLERALSSWHLRRAEGDLRVIVTASPQETVAPFARRLGADALIGSRLACTTDGRVGEGLDGPNCRGEEKVRRLSARFGADMQVGDAYGDTGGDLQMLAIAARGHMRVFTARPAGPPRP